MRGPRIDAEAALAADSAHIFLIENFELEPKPARQFFLPLQEHRRRTTDHDFPHRLGSVHAAMVNAGFGWTDGIIFFAQVLVLWLEFDQEEAKFQENRTESISTLSPLADCPSAIGKGRQSSTNTVPGCAFQSGLVFCVRAPVNGPLDSHPHQLDHAVSPLTSSV
jgi:hypothetical protein